MLLLLLSLCRAVQVSDIDSRSLRAVMRWADAAAVVVAAVSFFVCIIKSQSCAHMHGRAHSQASAARMSRRWQSGSAGQSERVSVIERGLRARFALCTCTVYSYSLTVLLHAMLEILCPIHYTVRQFKFSTSISGARTHTHTHTPLHLD